MLCVKGKGVLKPLLLFYRDYRDKTNLFFGYPRSDNKKNLPIKQKWKGSFVVLPWFQGPGAVLKIFATPTEKQLSWNPFIVIFLGLGVRIYQIKDSILWILLWLFFRTTIFEYIGTAGFVNARLNLFTSDSFQILTLRKVASKENRLLSEITSKVQDANVWRTDITVLQRFLKYQLNLLELKHSLLYISSYQYYRYHTWLWAQLESWLTAQKIKFSISRYSLVLICRKY